MFNHHIYTIKNPEIDFEVEIDGYKIRIEKLDQKFIRRLIIKDSRIEVNDCIEADYDKYIKLLTWIAQQIQSINIGEQ